MSVEFGILSKTSECSLKNAELNGVPECWSLMEQGKMWSNDGHGLSLCVVPSLCRTLCSLISD